MRRQRYTADGHTVVFATPTKNTYKYVIKKNSSRSAKALLPLFYRIDSRGMKERTSPFSK